MKGFSAYNSVARPSHKAKSAKTNNADGVKNVAAIQIVSGLVCITLQVGHYLHSLFECFKLVQLVFFR